MRLILRFFGILFSAGAVLFVVGAAVGRYFYWKYSQDLPDHAALANYEPPVMTRVHAADGSLLAEYARERRLYRRSRRCPRSSSRPSCRPRTRISTSTAASNPEGIVRAFLTNAKSGKRQGASTITQQVAKNFLLSSEQTYDRKIKEALLALRIEAAYSKDKILELYLNEIFLGTIVPGRNLHGVAAAALDYFGKSVHELTINEAAYLAALPKGPNNYHPYRKTQAALDRRNEIIRLMAENATSPRRRRIPPRRCRSASTRASPSRTPPTPTTTFTEEVRREISERYGEKKLYEGGLSVRTTLDPKMQGWARKALVDGLVRYDQAQGWRGPVTKVDLTGRELGHGGGRGSGAGRRGTAGASPCVLGNGGGGVQIGLQPKREASGQVVKDRETGVITPEGMRWAGRANLQPGDMVYVEAMDGGRGQFRLRQKPEVFRRHRGHGPEYGPGARDGRRLLVRRIRVQPPTQAMRQPGSSFKPIVYSAALDKRLHARLDHPWTPRTPSRPPPRPGGLDALELRRQVRRPPHPALRHRALENLMTVRLAKDVGMPLIADYARRFGVLRRHAAVLPMSLGAGEDDG